MRAHIKNVRPHFRTHSCGRDCNLQSSEAMSVQFSLFSLLIMAERERCPGSELFMEGEMLTSVKVPFDPRRHYSISYVTAPECTLDSITLSNTKPTYVHCPCPA